MFIVLLVFGIQQDRRHGQIADLALVQLSLERNIGYGGFIHNFKNAVLRPDEPRHLSTATQQLDSLMKALDELDEILKNIDSPLATDPIRLTFAEYGEKLRILQEHQKTLTARELDGLVRVTDDNAVDNLQYSLDAVSVRLKEDYRQTTLLIYLSLALMGFAFLGIILLLRRTAKTREQAVANQVRAELLDQENIRLEEANQDLRSFSYALSHDLKSPTNTARMLLRELREYPKGELAEEDQDFLNKADRQLERIQKLIADVLGYTQVAQTESANHGNIHLRELIDEVLSDLEADIVESGARVQVGESMPSVWGHPMQIRLLLQNLIGNAIKFRRTDATCVVEVNARHLPGANAIEIWVKDNGPGVSPEHHAKIFEMFQRVDKRANISGTGLGLALCRRVASNHGGSITLKCHASTPGSVFSVTLPQPVKE